VGRVSYYYDGGGHVIDMPLGNASSYAAFVAGLKQNEFVDRKTRAVLVHLNVFNANMNHFCIVRAVRYGAVWCGAVRSKRNPSAGMREFGVLAHTQ